MTCPLGGGAGGSFVRKMKSVLADHERSVEILYSDRKVSGTGSIWYDLARDQCQLEGPIDHGDALRRGKSNRGGYRLWVGMEPLGKFVMVSNSQ